MGTTEEKPVSTTTARHAVVNYFSEHPVLIPALATLIASTVGYACEGYLLRAFGISIADYADVDDFLLAGLKRPAQSAMFIGLFVLVLIFAVASYNTQRAQGSSGIRAVFSMIFLLFPMFTFFVPRFVKSEAAFIRDPVNHKTVATLRNGKTIPEGGADGKLSLITATNSYLFFHRIVGDQELVVVIPTANILSLETPTTFVEPK